MRMGTFELIMMLMCAVLISAIVDQVVPRISLPLIQIALGIVISLFSLTPIEVHLDPELFLVLFIAPLLFNDALELNKKTFYDNRFSILSYAIGLVLVIMLCVGFTLHWLVPSIPLAAAFALGAALGPTDAVAAAALRQEAQIGKREGAILQGESLINDASGVVSFQFAIAAAVTGGFSLLDASASFAVSFFGGIGVGSVLAFLFLFCARRIRQIGVDSITFHVLLEVAMPFLVYMIAEHIGVSGILAVVSCGILWSIKRDHKISPHQSRLNIALTSVWSVVSFVLNGIVFVLLGVLLPHAIQPTWDDVSIGNVTLVGYVLLLTAVIVGLRFVWVILMTRATINPDTGKREVFSKKMLISSLVTTVGGPKGAITLSILFTIPYSLADGSLFPQRSLIIFLASGVIICTLLISNFLLPVLAPRREKEVDAKAQREFDRMRVEVLRTVIERLMADSTPETYRAIRIVVREYNQRINAISSTGFTEAPIATQLRVEVIEHQAEELIHAASNKEIEPYAAYHVIHALSAQKDLIVHAKGKSLAAYYGWGRIRRFFALAKHSILSWLPFSRAEEKAAVDKARALSERYAVEYLRQLVDNPRYPSEVVARFLIRHEQALAVFAPSIDATVASEAMKNAMVSTNEIQQHSLQLELEIIQDFYLAGDLTRAQAKEMRDNAQLMRLDVENQVLDE